MRRVQVARRRAGSARWRTAAQARFAYARSASSAQPGGERELEAALGRRAGRRARRPGTPSSRSSSGRGSRSPRRRARGRARAPARPSRRRRARPRGSWPARPGWRRPSPARGPAPSGSSSATASLARALGLVELRPGTRGCSTASAAGRPRRGGRRAARRHSSAPCRSSIASADWSVTKHSCERRSSRSARAAGGEVAGEAQRARVLRRGLAVRAGRRPRARRRRARSAAPRRRLRRPRRGRRGGPGSARPSRARERAPVQRAAAGRGERLLDRDAGEIVPEGDAGCPRRRARRRTGTPRGASTASPASASSSGSSTGPGTIAAASSTCARRRAERRDAGEHGVADRLRQLDAARGERLGDEERVAGRAAVAAARRRRRAAPRARRRRRARERREPQPVGRVAARELAERDPQRVRAVELVVAVAGDDERGDGRDAPAEQAQDVERRLVGPVDVLEARRSPGRAGPARAAAPRPRRAAAGRRRRGPRARRR